VTNVVSGGPADAAGLRPGSRTASAFGVEFPSGGDVIVAIDGQPVAGSADIARIVTSLSPGQLTRFTVERGHSRLQLSVRLSERSDAH
jgi:S1-C subfamily serine protease